MDKFIDKYFPNSKEIIEREKNKPSTEERLAAVENAIVDMALNQMGVDE